MPETTAASAPIRSAAAAVRYALLFAVLSIAFEVAVLAVLGLRISENNAIIAPAVLLLAPLAAALLLGYRSRVLLKLVATSALFTLVLSVVGGTVTGILAPILLRPAAGFFSAWVSLEQAADAPVRR